ncbi:7,8-didemethyl-8-hydroxy-5-deazariboflavin synthase subunit CofG [Leptolyngbyaceae cyanobacterium CCMR0082]|uniref:7,8-didemethyl-8-hydroxy-5-deazariboflavin synthase n=1 Tax=Adonisia turfae CCMR0082 TaxID=2304604 RepID=A0A6M0SAG9_9CYAN|nr:7,8-didemethyl-8-hydroxy-5-deazariboflavin synthase subunit CofG [Adonisia turfae]NEZ64981.1 7,8-didemethyl-8-hydroxy-5-deazariboflavin synthase subunit CofG [Adonisia turfae CCMR0082]
MSLTITYSPAYTLVPTYECFNQCSYCNFRVQPGSDIWLSLPRARAMLQELDAIEILILSGEVHPKSSRRRTWLDRIYDLCHLAIAEGFLPHTNVGPLSFEEMKRLKQVNVSMGLMLEQLTPALLDNVHHHAPSKRPAVRLEQLMWAGQLQIPFTTGLLLGIGETETDWEETLVAIATLHNQYGHIQEVILQPHQPGERQTQLALPCDDNMLIRAVHITRQILPEDITIQIPPNLVQSTQTLLACLKAGARDLGGIGPLDEVNPTYHHKTLSTLTAQLQTQNYSLTPRLPVYSQYDSWLPANLQQKVQSWRTRLDSRKTLNIQRNCEA